MSDEDKTVKMPDSIEEIGGNIHSASQQLVEDIESTFRPEGSQHYVQDTSATPEEEESVEQERTMHETPSSVQRQDEEIQGEIKKLEDPKNQSLTFGKELLGNADQEIEPGIKLFLMQKMKEMEQKLIKVIQTEVQSAVKYEFKKVLEGNKSEQIRFAQSTEQDTSENDNQLELYQGFTSTISDMFTNLQKKDKESAQQTDFTSSTGMFTVICLDTSGSMEEHEAWDPAKRFYMEYLNGLKDTNDSDNPNDKVALVVFGNETKVRLGFTSDFDSLKYEFDKLKPEGPSPMVEGLRLSIAEADISDKRYPHSQKEIWPKIILITNGRPTHVKIIDGSDDYSEENVQEAKSLILKEVKRLRDERIELKIVYVGKADYEFLHELRECTNGDMMPSTDGEKTAKCNVMKAVMKASNTLEVQTRADDSEETEKSKPDLDHLIKTVFLDNLCSLNALTKGIPKMITKTETKTKTHERYVVLDDKKYPAIGSRVKRSKDWTWGEQDGNGVGTIIGHHSKDQPKESQRWVWVEWDENEDVNVYRFKTFKRTKNDIEIVQDERIPPDDCPIAVGMKVTTGKDFKGKEQPEEGVVIRMCDTDDPDQGSKAEVLWNDGKKAEYYFGDEGTEVEIEPKTLPNKPDKPRSLKVHSVSDKEVCLKWERPASCGGCSIKKYTVFKKSDHEDSKWLKTTEVDGSQTSATICDLLPKEKYKFSVRAENKIGFGQSAETESITLDLKHNRPQSPEGPVLLLEITKGSCTLSWSKSYENPMEPITHYLIELREKNGKWKSIPVGLNTSFKMSGLRKSTKYEVRIKAVNENGESDPLGIESFQTLTLLDYDIPDAELQDIHITELAQGIGQNWEMLGPHFNRANVEISRIKLEYPQSVVLQIKSMLSKWKCDMGSQATFHTFLKGVEKFPTVDVNWDIIEKVARQFRNEAACN